MIEKCLEQRDHNRVIDSKKNNNNLSLQIIFFSLCVILRGHNVNSGMRNLISIKAEQDWSHTWLLENSKFWHVFIFKLSGHVLEAWQILCCGWHYRDQYWLPVAVLCKNMDTKSHTWASLGVNWTYVLIKHTRSSYNMKQFRKAILYSPGTSHLHFIYISNFSRLNQIFSQSFSIITP